MRVEWSVSCTNSFYSSICQSVYCIIHGKLAKVIKVIICYRHDVKSRKPTKDEWDFVYSSSQLSDCNIRHERRAISRGGKRLVKSILCAEKFPRVSPFPSLRSKRFRASSSRTSGREQKKKECSRSNFRAMTQLEALATQAMKMRPHLAAHPH